MKIFVHSITMQYNVDTKFKIGNFLSLFFIKFSKMEMIINNSNLHLYYLSRNG